MHNPNILAQKTLLFAIRIVKLFQFLNNEKKEFILSKQLLRSGTNSGAMIREASMAESGLDFIHKLSIAQKEICETRYWLELLKATDFLNENEFISIDNDAEEILKILTKSILTKKKNLQEENLHKVSK
jgi:four helix bundle protein